MSASAPSASLLVAAGILLSRFSGLIRERAFAHYFGNSDAGDAFKAALKIPNFLQNLFGEGVLSASFIPVYAGLQGQGKTEDARKVAHVIGTLLALAVSLCVALGVVATPWMIDLIAPGFLGEKRDLTIRLVRIFFPGTGLLVLSAWCLGILNSHRRFFLSYAAPVLWNAAIIAALLAFGATSTLPRLAELTAWGLVVGSLLQFLSQFPSAIRLLRGFRPRFDTRLSGVGTVIRNFLPSVVSRGVVQVSAYIDSMIASFLPTGAVSSLSYAQTLYLLPVSLFGMSVSAAELPRLSEMASSTESPEAIATALRERLQRALRQVAFLIVPSAFAFVTLGNVVIAALYQSGQFAQEATFTVWVVLAAYSIGLLPATLGRIYSSAFYALKDTRTPLRFSIVRVGIATALGLFASLILPGRLGFSPSLATAGLSGATAVASLAEFLLLKRALSHRIGALGLPLSWHSRVALSAALASGVGFAVRHWVLTAIPTLHPILVAAAVLGPFGLIYFGISSALKIPEAQAFTRRVTQRFFKKL